MFFGGTINPLTAGEQFKRRIQLQSLLDLENPNVRVLNDDFEQFLQDSEQIANTRDKFSSLEEYEIKMVEIFTYLRIKHKPDVMTYLTIDHLPTISEVVRSGVDDCDGRAIFAANILLYRGFEVWILAHPLHYWVEVFLENGTQMHILAKSGINTWYLRFNNQESILNYFQTIGFILYEWFLVSVMLIFLFYSHQTFSKSPFIRMTVKTLIFVIVITQIIYCGALGVVLLLYRILWGV